MPVTRTTVGSTWSIVASGRTSGTVMIDIYDRACLIHIGNSEPGYADLNHYREPGEHMTVALDEGENLYMRTGSTGQTARVVATVTAGSIGQGIDERVYLGAERAITTQPFVEANVKNGTQFSISHEFLDVAQAATVNIVFSTGSMDVLVKGRSIQTSRDNVLYEVFRAPTVSGGTAIPVSNYNEVDPVAATASLVYAATISSAGTLIDHQPIYGAVDSGNRVSGFTQTSGIERRLAKNAKYLVRFTNRSTTAAVNIHYGLTWYEGILSSDV